MWVLDSIDWSKPKILDFGAGDSLLPSYLNFHGFNVSILDLFWYEVQKSIGTKFVQGDVLYAPFADLMFEQIIAVSVIEHIERDEWALNELSRILTPGGQFLITVLLGIDPLRGERFNGRRLRHFELENFVLVKERYLYVNTRNKWIELRKEEIDDRIQENSSFKGLACLVLQKTA
ncbi:MAG: class I SAM-dependent methyltransferase [Tepidanaerobacteraceae bacterium]|jgi:SAM-dependent methyltransferase|nr:class I SAM-dependent methyltransferase [Tepidanaerobacteraceae bacterium]